MVRVRVHDPDPVTSLCAFFASAGGRAERDAEDAGVLHVELPGAISALRERYEVAAYLTTWSGLSGGKLASVDELAA